MRPVNRHDRHRGYCRNTTGIYPRPIRTFCKVKPILMNQRTSFPQKRFSTRSSTTLCCARRGWGPTLPPRIAWIVQESPSFLIPVTVLAIGGDALLNQMHWQAKAIGACFLAHYLHRAFVFPLNQTPSKPTPIVVSLCAYIFTTWNGLLQVSPLPLHAHRDLTTEYALSERAFKEIRCS